LAARPRDLAGASGLTTRHERLTTRHERLTTRHERLTTRHAPPRPGPNLKSS
jgi:hypothetical protein